MRNIGVRAPVKRTICLISNDNRRVYGHADRALRRSWSSAKRGRIRRWTATITTLRRLLPRTRSRYVSPDRIRTCRRRTIFAIFGKGDYPGETASGNGDRISVGLHVQRVLKIIISPLACPCRRRAHDRSRFSFPIERRRARNTTSVLP